MAKMQIKRATLVDPDSGAQFSFPLNPETMEQESPYRVNIVHTADGWYADCYGPAAGTLVITGTTGKGYGPSFEALREVVEGWQERAAAGERPSLMEFHNWQDGEHYKVAIRGLRKRRDIRGPLLFRYELTMGIISSDIEKNTASPAMAAVSSFSWPS